MKQPAYLAVVREIPVRDRKLPRVEYKCKCCSVTGIVFAWEWAENPQKCPKSCTKSKEFIAEEKRQAAAASPRKSRERLKPKPIDFELVKSLVLNGCTLRECAESLGVGLNRMGTILKALRKEDAEVRAAFEQNIKKHQRIGGHKARELMRQKYQQ